MAKALASIEIDAPARVEVGHDLAFSVRVVTYPVLDLSGVSLQVRFSPDAPDAPAQGETITLAVHDGVATETDELVCTAPDAAGRHVWRITLPAGKAQGIPYPQSSLDFGFEVLPERPGIVVWNVPPTVPKGANCTVRVGAKCTSGAALSGSLVEIRDSDGTTVARGHLESHPSQGTGALYHADIAFSVPDREALHRYSVHMPGQQQAPSRLEASGTFTVRVVPEPEVKVRVQVVQESDGTPLAGLHVRMHPYRATTDARGLAKLSLPRGRYQLHVSGRRFVAHSSTIESMVDTDLRVGLVEEVPYEHL